MILVRPRGGENVGAVCRAIKNLAGGQLVIVDGRFDVDGARRMAVHADDVLAARLEVATLREALTGCSLVVGTTVRGGPYRSTARDIRELSSDLLRAEAEVGHGGQPPAMVFGPEDSGLSNEEIAACHQLAVIPTDPAYASLNLAQAVLLALYELFRARGERRLTAETAHRVGTTASDAPAGAADAGQVEDMFADLERALLAIGFLSEDNPQHVMMTLRSILARSALDERELRMLRGVARQVLWFAGGGWQTAQEKKERGEKLR